MNHSIKLSSSTFNKYLNLEIMISTNYILRYLKQYILSCKNKCNSSGGKVTGTSNTTMIVLPIFIVEGIIKFQVEFIK